MTAFLQYFTYLSLRVFLVIMRLIPFSAGLKFARFMGGILYYVLGRRRKIALENLRAAFGKEKIEEEIKKIAKESFEHLGIVALEFMWTPHVVRHFDSYLKSEGKEKVQAALQRGKGVILLCAHLGNWEWIGLRMAFDGFPSSAIARSLRNPFLYRYIMKIRGLTGLKIVNKNGATRETLRILAEGKVVGIVMDQHERQGSVQVEFFGRPAFTTTLPARLALKREAAVFPMVFQRSQSGPSRFIYENEFPLIKTGNNEQDIFENTKQYMQALERQIRTQPGNWLWMHKRWR